MDLLKLSKKVLIDLGLIYFLAMLAVLWLVPGCASSAEKWYVKDVPPEEREWRYCDEMRDGPGKFETGICYISQKCRKVAGLWEKCVPDPLYCKWGDIPCFRKHKWPKIKKGGVI